MSALPTEPLPGGPWFRAVRLAAWGWTGLIMVLLWMPPPPPPENILWWWDLAVHSCLMIGFAGLWTWRGLPGRRLLPIGVAFGALTELVQGLLPWPRHSALDDFGADVAGLLVGWTLARLLWPPWSGDRPRVW